MNYLHTALPIKRVHLAFVPMLAFLLLAPATGYGDELKSVASPREVARIAGWTKKRPVQSTPKISYRVKKTIKLNRVSAYSSTKDQCDADPFTTASGAKVADGLIAHNGLPFGTKVRFPDYYGDRVFTVADRMSTRFGSTAADIWMPTRSDAMHWGVKRSVRLEVIEQI